MITEHSGNKAETNTRAKRISDVEAWQVVLNKSEWVRGMAKRLAWGGAELDDLYQEGRVAAFRLLKSCHKATHARYHMEKYLPHRLIAMAQRMRRRFRTGSIEDLVYTSDPHDDGPLELETALGLRGCVDRSDLEIVRTVEAKTEAEKLKARLRPLLTARQLALVELLLDGYSRVESASILGISPQAVDRHIVKMRPKVRYVVDGLMEEE